MRYPLLLFLLTTVHLYETLGDILQSWEGYCSYGPVTNCLTGNVETTETFYQNGSCQCCVIPEM